MEEKKKGERQKAHGLEAHATGAVVIKIGGSTLEDVGRLGALWKALVEISHRPGACATVLVHGGGKAVDGLLKRLDLPVERRNGLRVTPPEQMELIAGVLAGTVNKQLVGAINAAGGAAGGPGWGRAVGLCVGDGGMLECRVMSEELGRVGEVCAAAGHSPSGLEDSATSPAGSGGGVLGPLLKAGYLPVVSSIGMDASGGLLNLNADDAAAGIAGAVGASRLVLLTDVPGIKGGDGVLRPTLTASQVEAMIASGEITGGMIVKARSAVAAGRATGAAVVIMSGETPDALLRYLAGGSVGTTITG